MYKYTSCTRSCNYHTVDGFPQCVRSFQTLLCHRIKSLKWGSVKKNLSNFKCFSSSLFYNHKPLGKFKNEIRCANNPDKLQVPHGTSHLQLGIFTMPYYFSRSSYARGAVGHDLESAIMGCQQHRIFHVVMLVLPPLCGDVNVIEAACCSFVLLDIFKELLLQMRLTLIVSI